MGGDRLPWVDFGNKAGAGNYESFKSLQWQAHCYGETSSAVQAACASRGLTLHTFAWQPQIKQAGLKRNAVYVVQPDGYIGLADPTGDASALERYLDRRQIRLVPIQASIGATAKLLPSHEAAET